MFLSVNTSLKGDFFNEYYKVLMLAMMKRGRSVRTRHISKLSKNDMCPLLSLTNSPG
jgi:hypothetical protein